MPRFQDWKIRAKLAFAFLCVFLPLSATAFLSVHLFTKKVKEEAAAQLTNTVRMILKLCGSEALGRGDSDEYQALLKEVVKRAVRNVRIEKTGYAYVMDTKGNLIVHPAREGENIIAETDTDGRMYIRDICQHALTMSPEQVGEARYPWMNVELGDKEPRPKLLKYVYYRPWDWIIAAGTYEHEIFQGVQETRRIVLEAFAATCTLIFILTLLLGHVLVGPLTELNAVTQRIAGGDLTQSVSIRRKDEIGTLAESFRIMAGQVRRYTQDLERTVQERSRRLAESERKYRTVVESSVDGIVTTDKRGYITFANHAMEEMVGEKRDELLGKHISCFYKRGLQEAREIMKELTAKGRFQNRELTLQSRNREIQILTSASLLQDENGEIVGTLGVFTDITERKRLEAELQKTQAHLVQTMKMRALGDLVAGVAHSINNPLMASNTILHVIAEDLDPESPNYKRVNIIRECNRRIEKIVQHLKDFSRQSDGRFALVDINSTIEDALLITGQQLLNRNIRIVKELTAEIPQPLIWGDANQLEEVFMELIANARDAMEESTREKVLTIASRVEETGRGKKVVVSITDTGKGIPKEIADKIFEPFFTTKEQGKGTGLGLSIAYGIIEQHRGTMEVESTEGECTTFRIALPVAHVPCGEA